MQYGTAAKTASRHSEIAAGFPGRLTTRQAPMIPAVCRERIAVGTLPSETARICSPNPGSMQRHTDSVASGVTSRAAGPVPPVVTIRLQDSASSTMAAAIASCSSGTSLRSGLHSEIRTRSSQDSIAGPPRSSYSPRLARSETVSTPMMAVSLVMPPVYGACRWND